MESIKINDILDYKFYSNLGISKDEKYLAFDKSKANLDKNKYDTYLYLFDINKEKAFKIDHYQGLYIFDKNDDLLYLKKSDKDFDYFYKKERNMAKASLYFKIGKNVSYIKEVDEDLFFIKASNKDEDSFYEKFDRLPFYSNGSGFIKGKNELYIYNKKSDTLKKIRAFNEDSLASFSLDWENKLLLMAVAKTDNKVTRLKEDLILMNLESLEEKVLIKDEFSFYDIFLDKDEFFFVASNMEKGGINEDGFIYRGNFDGNYKKISPKNFDKSFGNSIGTDARYGKFKTFLYKNKKLFFIVTEKEDSKLYSIIHEGKLELIEEGFVEDFAISKSQIFFIKMAKDRLSFIKDDKKILLDNKIDKTLGKIEEFSFTSNGDKLRGYVLLPRNFKKGKKYPTLLSIHGGPKTEFSDLFHHEHQVFANDGYIVIYTNPHGSSGNGVKFSDIRGRYGTIDYEDLMNFTDEAIKRYEEIDTDKMGVYGGSYGGFMTNWIIGHTDRFKAANSQRSISNWTSFYGVSDIGYYFASDQTGADFYENIGKMWDQSPLKFVKNVKTPTMFIHSDEDYRCPLDQGLQMYTGIKENGVDSLFYIFKGENHELSRSGRPKARIKRLEAIKKWFDGYLKWKKIWWYLIKKG